MKAIILEIILGAFIVGLIYPTGYCLCHMNETQWLGFVGFPLMVVIFLLGIAFYAVFPKKSH